MARPCSLWERSPAMLGAHVSLKNIKEGLVGLGGERRVRFSLPCSPLFLPLRTLFNLQIPLAERPFIKDEYRPKAQMLEGLELWSTCHLEPSLPAGSHSPLREAWLLRTVSDGALTPKDGWVSAFQNIDLCSILSMSWTGPVQGSGSEMCMDYFRWNVFLWLCILLGTFNTLATWCKELSHWKRPWCWERLKAGGEGTTEDEMVGWHHRLNGHEFEQAPGVGDGQGGLACCSPWGRKESDTTELLSWTGTFLQLSSQVHAMVLQSRFSAPGLHWPHQVSTQLRAQELCAFLCFGIYWIWQPIRLSRTSL